MRVGMSAERMTMPVIGVADVEMRRCVMFPLFLGRSRPVGCGIAASWLARNPTITRREMQRRNMAIGLSFNLRRVARRGNERVAGVQRYRQFWGSSLLSDSAVQSLQS